MVFLACYLRSLGLGDTGRVSADHPRPQGPCPPPQTIIFWVPPPIRDGEIEPGTPLFHGLTPLTLNPKQIGPSSLLQHLRQDMLGP